jgi:hypothetical protein
MPTPDEATTVEIKRSGTPEVAPPGRQDSGTGAVLGGEEGDDLAEDGVWEVSDAIDASSFFILPGRHRFALFRGRTARLRFHGAQGRLGFALVKGAQCLGEK